MALPTYIEGPGNHVNARVTSYGQLVTAPIAYNIPSTKQLLTINTAYNLVVPLSGKHIVIDSMIVMGDKSVGANGSVVEIYEATSPTTTTVSKSLFLGEIHSKESLSISNANLLTDTNRWVSAKCDDDDVYVSIYYYYVPVDTEL